MRIACLQFSPQVGDTDNNLNRGDAVLNKAKPEQLDELDLIVLPEMAFSGYNFKTLHQIHPFLEPSGSGISSLWARTTALKFNTKVLVGYPEKVDISKNWPTSPEYYDSAIMVNEEGETVLNYRKNFLHGTDQTWALEGPGFFCEEIDGLGKVCVGVGMDLNPYRNESPFHAFEFAHHALEVEADLVIVCMSWITRQEHREFSRTLAEPDMETLTYWVKRLEPLILAELEREIVVVFCNRCGQESEALYAGTSAILGIQGGEVKVYALAGRGTKEYLVADTNSPCFAKLINEDVEMNRETIVSITGKVDMGSSSLATPPIAPPPPPPAPAPMPAIHSAKTNQVMAEFLIQGNSIAPPRSVPPGEKRQRPSPKLQIPVSPAFSFSSMSAPVVGGSRVPESPIMIPTPEAPSPTPMALRPKLTIPETASVFGDHSHRKPSPYPHDNFLLEQHRFFGSRHQPITPATMNEDIDRTPSRYYWKPSDTLLNTPYEFTWERDRNQDTPIVKSSTSNPFAPLTPFPGAVLPDRTKTSRNGNSNLPHVSEEVQAKPQKSQRPEQSPRQNRSSPRLDRQPDKSVKTEGSATPKKAETSTKVYRSQSPSTTGTPAKANLKQNLADSLESSQKVTAPHRPASPKARSTSRSTNLARNGVKSPEPYGIRMATQHDGSSMQRTATPTDFPPLESPPWRGKIAASSADQDHYARPGSPKSRNASRNRRLTGDSAPTSHVMNLSRTANTNMAAVPIPNTTKTAAGDVAGRPPSRNGVKLQDSGDRPRPPSRSNHNSKDANDFRQRSDSIVQATIDQKGSNPVEAILTRLGMWPTSPGGTSDDTRPPSRGRPRAPIREGSGTEQPGLERQRRLSQVQAQEGTPTVRHMMKLFLLRSTATQPANNTAAVPLRRARSVTTSPLSPTAGLF
ncbi:Carbon-nitrogen hydrolase [Coniochaeta pulveracea]|uniref:Carbon-nitrogen hydrolase n=1 Tax=Coniochaeta pulveracea TaxID=177199 RepID=A0A420YBN3_9PEZI|nr:Carbon-nitrogen hydrolase [Coniochaeta pulveracea]